MANITHIGDGPVTWFGIDFEPNKAVDLDKTSLSDAQKDQMLRKAETNPFFEVGGGGRKDAGKEDDNSERGRAAGSVGQYEVQHRGRGKWAVVRGDDILADGLTKEEAEAHARDRAEADQTA